MMVLIASLLFAADLADLGSPDWRVRDAATRRLQSTIRGDLLAELFQGHRDPEVRQRLSIVSPVRWRFALLAAYLALAFRECADPSEALWWSQDKDRLQSLSVAARRLGLLDQIVTPATWELETQSGRIDPFFVQGFITVMRLRLRLKVEKSNSG